MAQKNRADLAVQLTNTIFANPTGDIDATDHATFLTDYSDSFVNKDDDPTLPDLAGNALLFARVNAGETAIEFVAGGGGGANLGTANIAANTLDVTSDSGTDATLPSATGSLAGLLPGIVPLTTETPVSGDFVLISDTSDGGNLKKVDASNFLSGGGGDGIYGGSGSLTADTDVTMAGFELNLLGGTTTIDNFVLGVPADSSSQILLDNNGSGKILNISANTAGFDSIELVLGTAGSGSRLNTSSGFWLTNSQIRMDTTGVRSILYCNNGGNGLALSGTNSLVPDIEIADNGDIGFFGATPASQQADAGTAAGTDAVIINNIVTALQNLGLMA